MNVFGEGPLGELPFKLNKLHAFGLLLLLLFIIIYFYFFLGGGGGHCSLTETAFKNESVHNFVPDLGQKMSTRNAVWIRCIGLSVWISTSRQPCMVSSVRTTHSQWFHTRWKGRTVHKNESGNSPLTKLEQIFRAGKFHDKSRKHKYLWLDHGPT